MKTKIFQTLIILGLISPMIYSQGGEKGKTTFGVLAGVNFQNLNGKTETGAKLTNDLLFGFHAGVNAQIPLVPEFYFQPGLLFSTKGAKLGTDKHKLSYIELPLNVLYKGMLGSGHVMLGLGPYLGYAVAGNVVDANGNKTEIGFKSEVPLSEEGNPYYKPLDVGGNIFFGYELSMGLFVQFNAQLGLIKINPDLESTPGYDAVTKNTGFGVSVGYRF